MRKIKIQMISIMLAVALCVTGVLFSTGEASAVGEMRDKTATISMETLEDCALAVSIYEEDVTDTNETDTKAPSKPGRVKIISCKSKRKGTVKLKWKKVPDSDGYWVQWSDNCNFSGGYGQILMSQQEGQGLILPGLKSKKKYYFRVRAYKEGNRANDYEDVYGSWSKVKKVRVK